MWNNIKDKEPELGQSVCIYSDELGIITDCIYLGYPLTKTLPQPCFAHNQHDLTQFHIDTWSDTNQTELPEVGE